jgi:transcriptional regulator with XRE-family HTH domain
VLIPLVENQLYPLRSGNPLRSAVPFPGFVPTRKSYCCSISRDYASYFMITTSHSTTMRAESGRQLWDLDDRVRHGTVLRKPDTRLCGPARLMRALCRSEFIRKELRRSRALFSVPKSGHPEEAAVHCALRAGDRMSTGGAAAVQLNGGQRLRTLRESLGYRMRDVELASNQIARRFGSEEFAIAPSRLSDIETKGIIPSIFRLYSFAAIYRREFRELLSFYGLELDGISADISFGHPQKSHVSEALSNVRQVRMPTKLDPGFSLEKTTDLGRAIEQWGIVPMSYLAQFAGDRYTYGYIGSEDFTMYPILPPGSFVQVDETMNKVGEGIWRSEFERPIYFVEMREGYTCCWCSLKRDSIVLQPHPLSPVSVRVLRYPQEAEVLGQIVGVAMRLGDWHYSGFQPTQKVRSALTSDAPGQLGRGV